MDRRKSFGARLGARLRARREARGWSQARLAESVRISPNYVGILERGVKLPTLDTLVALAAALDVTPSDLLGGTRVAEPWLDELLAVARSLPDHRRALAIAVMRALASSTERHG